MRNKRKWNLRFAILLSQSLFDKIVSSFYSGLLRRYVDIRQMQAKSKKGSSRKETSNGRRKLLWGGWKTHRHFLYTYWRPKNKKRVKPLAMKFPLEKLGETKAIITYWNNLHKYNPQDWNVKFLSSLFRWAEINHYLPWWKAKCHLSSSVMKPSHTWYYHITAWDPSLFTMW